RDLPDAGKLTLTTFNFTHWQNGHVEEQIHLPDAQALFKLMQDRFGQGLDLPKHGFTLAELPAVIAGFDTHPQAGK
ncbi:N-hydroxyarylamine O-acetyltransferase, partial [Enterobacter intestinihominis]